MPLCNANQCTICDVTGTLEIRYKIRNNYYNVAIPFTGLTAIRGGVPANHRPLLVSGTAAANSSANEGSAGSSTAVPGPTVPAADNEAIQELEVLLASARFTSNEH